MSTLRVETPDIQMKSQPDAVGTMNINAESNMYTDHEEQNNEPQRPVYFPKDSVFTIAKQQNNQLILSGSAAESEDEVMSAAILVVASDRGESLADGFSKLLHQSQIDMNYNNSYQDPQLPMVESQQQTQGHLKILDVSSSYQAKEDKLVQEQDDSITTPNVELLQINKDFAQ